MSALVQTVFNVPTLSGQVAGTNTIQLTATLSAASPETVGYMNEARAYIDSIDASISQRYQDIRLFNEAISSTDDTFIDSANESRMTWRAMENFASISNFTTIQNTVTHHTQLLDDIELNRSYLNNSINTLTVANGEQNTRLNNLETAIAPYADDLATLNTEINGHSTALNALQQFDQWVNAELTTLGLQIEEQQVRISNTEVTYADQNVLIQSLLDQGTDHSARLELVEASTSIRVQTDRFNAIDQSVATNSAQIASVAEGLTAYQQAQEALNTAQDQATLSNTQTIADHTQAIADNTQAIDSETANRIVADTGLSNQISTLSNTLNSESAARSAGDTALTNQMAGLRVDLQTDIDTRALRDGAETYTGEKTFLLGTNEVLTVSGTVNFGGDVNIAGALNTVNATQVDIDDSVINLNAGETGTPSQDAGLVVERGTAINAELKWNEATDRWQAGFAGDLQSLVLFDEFNSFVSNQTINNQDQWVANNNTQTQLDNYIISNDGSVADKLNRTGGTITGNLTISTTGSTLPLIINQENHPTLFLQSNSANASFLGWVNGRTILRHYNTTGGTNNEINMFDSFSSFTKPLRVNIAPVHVQDLTNKAYVDGLDGQNLKLVGDQTIAGNKTFTGVTRATSLRTDTLATNAASFVFTDAPLRYSATAVSNVVNENELINKGYVDDTFLPQSGGNIDGNLTVRGIITGNNSGFGNYTCIRARADSPTGWSGYEMYDNGARSGLLYRLNTDPSGEDLGTLRLRRYNTRTNATTTEMVLGAGSAFFNCPLAVVDSGNANTATTRGYVDSSFIRNDGGVSDGELTFNSTTDHHRRLTFNNPGATGPVQGDILFRQQGVASASIFNNHNALTIRRFGTNASSINLWDSGVNMEGAFLSLNGTGFGNTTTIRSRQDSDSGWAGFDTADVGQRSSLIYRTGRGTTPGVDNGQLRIRLYDLETNNTTSEIAMSHGSINFNVPITVPMSTTETTAVNRGYVDDTFLSKITGGTMGGHLFIRSNAPSLNLMTESTSLPAINFSQPGHTFSQMYHVIGGDYLHFVKRDNTAIGKGVHNSISLYSDRTMITREVRCPSINVSGSGTQGGRIEFQEAPNNGFGSVALQGPDNISGDHVYKMPDTLPTVGQQLTAVAVNGNTVTLGWS